ncbi:dihydrolipoamide acetyltransferase family protein [Streptomyces sp. NBRC 109706]|uniref:dihydrolipoamide acetyltransferase family protein n=1 Tax=Streptomyces sp. NBRC 109706 TaxID=1550035 RepID=UPI000785ED1E|nr:dihydrolipoamide acetyltransferase family protein [Streptomyces sp. NBRC 109706]
MSGGGPVERVFRLPDLGEGLTGAEVVAWRVTAGAEVAVDDVVVEVETAKAAVEVPVPFAGTVVALHAEVGASVAVGAPLISVGVAEPAGGGRPATPDAAGERYREEERAGSGAVLVGYGTGGGRARRRGRSGRSAPRGGVAGGGATPPPAAEGWAPRVISPLVRRLAREHGVDVASLTPSAPRGVVRRRDVEAALARRAEPPAAGAGAGAVEERVPLRGLRRTVAERVARSRREIPDATAWVDVDASGLLAARDAVRVAYPEARVGLLALVARICVAGLARFPELNATVDVERDEIVRFGSVGLGFAAQTERGLVVPVVREAQRLSTVELAAELGRLTDRARAGALSPAELAGGTFTVNNYGVFGVDGSTPIINHPEAGLLGVGRVVDRPWVVAGALEVRPVAQVSFTFDHRVTDGGVAGGFLRFVADRMERPELLLAEL